MRGPPEAPSWLLLLRLAILLLTGMTSSVQLSGAQQAAAGRLYPKPAYETPDYWAKEAREELDRAGRVTGKLRYAAKNVILFIGDGMGISTVTAGRILKGQLANTSGEEATLAFDAFDHAGLIRTYNTDRQTPDSASTATAFLCGYKTNHYTLGVNQNALYSRCSTYNSQEHDVASFLKLASVQGRSTGVVTTATITGATPAPAYASSVSRTWQDDTDREKDTASPDTAEQRRACPDIATQLVERGVNFTVMMGGGRRKFLPTSVNTTDHVNNRTVKGTRSDGVNLVERWRRLQTQFGRRPAYVETADELANLRADSVDSVLGLVAVDEMQYHVTNIRSKGYREPSLADMTRKTLEVLAKNPKGYALLVEGARIDSGHHANRAQKALHDLIAMDEAVQAAVDATNPEDTLIVVSADHSHVFNIGYYGYRGQPIFDKVISQETPLRYAKAPDNIDYTVVSYGDGPNAKAGKPRANITDHQPEDSEDYRYPALVPRHVESHGAEDVSVLARGPGAHLFHSVHQQTYIAHVIMKAACLGWYAETGNCLRGPGPDPIGTTTPRGATKTSSGSLSTVLSGLLIGAAIAKVSSRLAGLI